MPQVIRIQAVLIAQGHLIDSLAQEVSKGMLDPSLIGNGAESILPGIAKAVDDRIDQLEAPIDPSQNQKPRIAGNLRPCLRDDHRLVFYLEYLDLVGRR